MSLNPTPEWAITQVERILKTDDPDALDALLSLLAGIAPTEEEEKYKHDAACAAIIHGYKKTRHCEQSAWGYLREVL